MSSIGTTKSLYRMETTLHDNDKYCWGIYTSMKYATPENQRIIWSTLTDEQKDEIRTIRRAAT